jgi:hypothetical protein
MAHHEQQPEPPLGPVPVVTTYANLGLPLDAYQPTPESLALWVRAGEVLTRQCMRRYGLDWPHRPTAASSRPAHDRRYGILDPHQVATLGYHPPPITGPRRDRSSAPLFSQDQMAVAQGAVQSYHGVAVRPGGCLAEAQRLLTAGAPDVRPGDASPVLPQEMEGDATTLTTHDSRLRKVWADWSECMTARGFRYATPWHANNDPQWRTPTASAQEIATATADLACRQQTNLVGLWYAIEVAYQNRAIEQHTAALARWKAAVEANTNNALRILGRG